MVLVTGDKKNTIEVEFDPFTGPEIERIVPCTEPQVEILTACLLGGNEASLAFNESITLQFSGPLDYAAMQHAFQKLINRHESLRSVCSIKNKQLCIFKDLIFELPCHDISLIADIEKQPVIKEYIHQDSLHLFDLVNGPLFKAGLIKSDSEAHCLVITAHHIICDGWSLGIILQDLSKLYSAQVQNIFIDLPTPVLFSRFAREQTTFLQSNTYQEIEKFWEDQYRDAIPIISLPTDFARPSVRTYKSSRLDYTLDNNLVAGIKSMATKAGCSLVTSLLAAFETLLYRLTGQTEIVTGLPAAGQSVTGNYQLVGHCVNLLPLRSNPAPELSFLQYLEKRKSAIFDAYEHQQLTFGSLLKKLKIPRDPSRIPLVPVVFNIDMGMDDGVDFFGLQYKLASNPRSYENFELFLNVSGSENGLTLEWSYNIQLFTAATINGMMNGFEKLLQTITANPAIALGNIEPLKNRAGITEARQPKSEVTENAGNRQDPTAESVPFNLKEKEASIFMGNQFNNPQLTNINTINIIDLFEEEVNKRPGNIALEIDKQSINYQELNERSNQFAHYLLGKGVKEEMLVPICIERGINMIVGILGILKAGGAYVPIDPVYPKDRINFILKDTDAKLVVSSSDCSIKFQDAKNTRCVALDSDWLAITNEPRHNLKIKIRQTNLAYIIYTSGSTGTPKGVMIEHQALAASTLSRRAYYGNMGAMFLIPSFAFDSSVAILFGTLTTGAKLILCHDHEIKETVAVKRLLANAEAILCVPSYYRFLLDNGLTKNARLTKVILAGERLDAQLVTTHFKQTTNTSLYNEYGPTEGAVWSTVAAIQTESNPVTIGKPINSIKMYILNADLLPVAPGVTGQLCISGLQVARGYLNQPELTAEKFIPNPYSTDPGERMYTTGDMGRWLANDEIEYLGRIDDQVKIRGYRIELGEIERVLLDYPGVKEAVVIAKDDGKGSQYLLGFIVPVTTLTKEAINAYLVSKLPEYMIPLVWIEMEQLPLTSNGKTDKKALVNIDIAGLYGQHFEAPRNEKETMLAAIWKDLLTIENPGIHDDFFELGGHSLVAIEVMTRIEKLTGKKLPPSILFQYPTIAKLAMVLDDQADISKWKSLVPIKPSGTKDPLYIIHGAGLDVMVFNNIAKYMDIDQPVYGIKAKGKDGDAETLETIEEMASFYISEIIEQNPSGPYLLAGFSAGSVVAFEMARQLLSMNKKIKLLGNIDFDLEDAAINTFFSKKTGLQFLPRLLHVLKSLIQYPKQAFKFQLMCLSLRYQGMLARLDIDKKTKSEGLYLHIENAMGKYGSALKSYVLKPLDIEIHIFSTEIKVYYLQDAKFLGWKPFALKGIKKHMVPGDHDDMLLPPNDKQFARVLQQVLDKL